MWAARADYTTARLIAPLIFLGMGVYYDVTTDRSYDSQATSFIDVFGLFLDMLYMGVLYNQALADVRSTVAGIKYLHL